MNEDTALRGRRARGVRDRARLVAPPGGRRRHVPRRTDRGPEWRHLAIAMTVARQQLAQAIIDNPISEAAPQVHASLTCSRERWTAAH